MTLQLNDVAEEESATGPLRKDLEARFLGRKMSLPAVDKNEISAFSPNG